MPYVHSLLIPYVYVAQTFSLRSTDAQTKRSNRKPRIENLCWKHLLPIINCLNLIQQKA